jgi:hypothetical protein
MDQLPMLKAVAARVAVQKRKCREIFLTLSMFAFELKSWGRDEPHRVKMCKLSNNRHSGAPPIGMTGSTVLLAPDLRSRCNHWLITPRSGHAP